MRRQLQEMFGETHCQSKPQNHCTANNIANLVTCNSFQKYPQQDLSRMFVTFVATLDIDQESQTHINNNHRDQNLMQQVSFRSKQSLQ